MDIPHTRRVQRVRHEIHHREVEVADVRELGPGFISVSFGGDALAGFISAGFDDHVKFIFPNAAGESIRRDYTPRHYDAANRRLTLEFALHENGPASDWARQAAIGQRVTIAGPRGSMIVPTDYDWHLLAGDSAALPAIHRRLEELPAGTHAIVVAQAADTADRRPLTSAARLDLHWVATPEELVETVRALALPAGEGYAWGAGEAATMARLREVMVQTHRHPKEAMRIAAYWRQGAAGFHEELSQ